MKKYLIIIFIICILFCTSCSQSIGTKQGTVFTTQLNMNEHNNSANITFSSYEHLYQSLSLPTSAAHKELTSRSDEYDLGEKYTSLLSKFSSGEIELYIPTINGTPIVMDEETGGITLFSRELYSLPWIWYRGEYNDGSVIVCITYTDIVESVENCKTYLEVLNTIAPNAPIPNNFSKDSYTKVEEIEMTFNGSTHTALFRHATSGRTYYSFLYDNMMISIWSHSADTLDDTFWQTFSLEPYKRIK